MKSGISARIPDELKEKLEKIATERGVPVSKVIEEVLNSFMLNEPIKKTNNHKNQITMKENNEDSNEFKQRKQLEKICSTLEDLPEMVNKIERELNRQQGAKTKKENERQERREKLKEESLIDSIKKEYFKELQKTHIMFESKPNLIKMFNLFVAHNKLKKRAATPEEYIKVLLKNEYFWDRSPKIPRDEWKNAIK